MVKKAHTPKVKQIINKTQKNFKQFKLLKKKKPE